MSWRTKNFKGEDRVAAVAVLELLKDGKCYLWSIFFTTCDPFFLDNFTLPLGLDFNEKRATLPSENALGKLITHPSLKCVEQMVFLEQKIKDHMVANAKDLHDSTDFRERLRQRALDSRFLSSTGIREIVGVRASGVPTAESKRSVCTNEEFKKLEKEEKEDLLHVIKCLSDVEFYDMYEGWLKYIAELPMNLYPAEYKKRGRWMLLSKEEVQLWDRNVFLYILSARSRLVHNSPFDAALWLGSNARVFAEVSCDDNRFASRTPHENFKLGDMLTEERRDWIISETEKVVNQQGAYLAKLKMACDAGDHQAALIQLTEGTAEPRFGQGLLGLSEALLRDLTTDAIEFPVELMTAIRLRLGDDWSIRLLAVNTTTDPAEPTYERLFKIGDVAKGG